MKVVFSVLLMCLLSTKGVYGVMLTKESEERILNKATLFIAKKEGFSHFPYLCASKKRTIGFGDTNYLIKHPKTIFITKKTALLNLKAEVKKIYNYIKNEVIVIDYHNGESSFQIVDLVDTLSEKQIIALISFTYNVGYNGYKDSSLKKQIMRYASGKEKSCKVASKTIFAEFMKWSYSKHKGRTKLNRGLFSRRLEEANYFVSLLCCNQLV